MTSLTIRYDDELHRKLKVIAAHRGISLNSLMMRIFRDTVSDWEREHGPVLLLDEEPRG